jgi:hypothetical protein
MKGLKRRRIDDDSSRLKSGHMQHATQLLKLSRDRPNCRHAASRILPKNAIACFGHCRVPAQVKLQKATHERKTSMLKKHFGALLCSTFLPSIRTGA